MWRDGPGWAIYFFAYEKNKQLAGISDSDTTTGAGQLIRRMIAGGMTGVFSWLCVYPFDIINTHIKLNLQKTETMSNVAIMGYR